jgi:hypothetical protein
MCFLQRLQGNMVLCAKQTATCGSMQKIHQQLVLCAISSNANYTLPRKSRGIRIFKQKHIAEYNNKKMEGNNSNTKIGGRII